MKRLGFTWSTGGDRRRIVAVVGVSCLVAGGIALGQLTVATAAPEACGTLPSGTSVYISCVVPPATTPYTTYSDGETINLSMGPNTVLASSVGSSIVAIECEYTNGSGGAGDPPNDTYCDATTGPGDFPYSIHPDGSFDYIGDNAGDLANVWALPDATFPHSTITCNTTDPCVWYVGEDYTNFAAPHVFSNPFLVSPAATTTTTSTTSTTTTTSTSTTSTTTSTTTPSTTTSTTTTTVPPTTTSTTTTTVPPTTTSTTTTVPPTTTSTTTTTVPPTTTSTTTTTVPPTTTSTSTSTTVAGPGSTTSTTTTGGATSGGGSGGSGGSSGTPVSSGSLAFTGTGPGTKWLAALGAALLLIGLLLLGLVDAPKRTALALAAWLPRISASRAEWQAPRPSSRHLLVRLSAAAGRLRRLGSSGTAEPGHGADQGSVGRAHRSARWILGR